MDIDGKGVEGEAFVNELAFSSYLKFWCYPGPKDEKGDKKEIADLLIIFNDVVIIISVKNYEFKGLYDRYFRRTLEKAVSQIYGAERKLFGNKQPLFIKHPDREAEEFIPATYPKVHRIIVNLGEDVLFYPSSSLTKGDKFVHILDKSAFEFIIKELDTIPDLIHYLQSREDVFAGKDVLMLPGEEHTFDSETAKQFFEYTNTNADPGERKAILISGTEYDVLAKYLENEKQFPDYFTDETYTNALLQLDGAWQDYEAREEVIRKRKHDVVSYFVDDFVKNELLDKPNELRLNAAKDLLSLSRLERRVVGQSFFETFEQYKGKSGWFFGRKHGKVYGVLMSFVIYGTGMKPEMVDTGLMLALQGYSLFEKYQTKKSILISANSNLSQFKFGFMKDIQPPGLEEEKDLIHDLDKLGRFKNLKTTHYTTKEYPEE